MSKVVGVKGVVGGIFGLGVDSLAAALSAEQGTDGEAAVARSGVHCNLGHLPYVHKQSCKVGTRDHGVSGPWCIRFPGLSMIPGSSPLSLLHFWPGSSGSSPGILGSEIHLASNHCICASYIFPAHEGHCIKNSPQPITAAQHRTFQPSASTTHLI